MSEDANVIINADATQFNAVMNQTKQAVDRLNTEHVALKEGIAQSFSNGRRFASLLAQNFKQQQLSQAFFAAEQTLSIGLSMKSTVSEIIKAKILATTGGQPSQWFTVAALTGVLTTQTALRVSSMRAQQQANKNARRQERMRLFTEAYR